MDEERTHRLISTVKWVYAKTMPKFPHEYIVRWNYPELDEDFCLFAQHIRDTGYPGSFFRKKLIYLNVGEWKYWTMGDPIHLDVDQARANLSHTTFILNRAKRTDDSGYSAA